MLVVAVFAFGCSGEHLGSSEPRARDLPPALAGACGLVRHRCSRCHTTERIERARLTEDGWQRQVRRMRLLPGSAIHADEEPALVRCLVFLTSHDRRLAAEAP